MYLRFWQVLLSMFSKPFQVGQVQWVCCKAHRGNGRYNAWSWNWRLPRKALWVLVLHHWSTPRPAASWRTLVCCIVSAHTFLCFLASLLQHYSGDRNASILLSDIHCITRFSYNVWLMFSSVSYCLNQSLQVCCWKRCAEQCPFCIKKLLFIR